MFALSFVFGRGAYGKRGDTPCERHLDGCPMRLITGTREHWPLNYLHNVIILLLTVCGECKFLLWQFVILKVNTSAQTNTHKYCTYVYWILFCIFVMSTRTFQCIYLRYLYINHDELFNLETLIALRNSNEYFLHSGLQLYDMVLCHDWYH